ncbi:MAG: PQQ-dependent sugar dehydrogenase [Microbacterium sp.]
MSQLVRRNVLRGATAVAAAVAMAVVGSVSPAVAEEPEFTEHLTFESYAREALGGQDGWTTDGAAEVVAGPLNGNNQVLEMTGASHHASRAIPEILDEDTGTLFFRFYRSGSVDTSFGITDVDQPTTYTDSRAYVNNQNSDTMLARDGGAFTPVGTWSENAWQCVWIVADNASDEIAVYSQGGAYEEQTRLPDGAAEEFGFRENVSGGLDRFFWINGSSSNGRLMLDDVAVDNTGENLANPTGNPADCAFTGEAEQPLQNPLPDPRQSTLGIEVEELAQLPESQTTPETGDSRLNRHNRITHLDEVPDDSGRLMVPDMNDILYLVDKDTGDHVPYLNVRDRFIDNFHNHAGLGTGLGFAEFHPEFAENGIFYTVHTEAGSALTEDEPDFPEYGTTGYHSVLTEWTASDPSAETFEGTSREVMRFPFAGRVHTVQQIAFNPTVDQDDADYGNLYILVGDGGNGVGNDNPQDPSTPHGTIMRVDPLGSDSENGQYGVPDDNPFLDEPGALPEIYAVGMRDPHRISWDSAGEHQMYLGHIGEWQVESIYEVEAGDNFGWSEREGSFLADNRQIFPLPEGDDELGYTYPVAAYDHNRDPGQTGDAGVATNGGFVYRGGIEELQGKYLFTDLVRGWVLATDHDDMVRNDGDVDDLAEISELRVFADGEETTFQELVGDNRVDLRFGSDADGELYLIAKANGTIWKVTGAQTVSAQSPIVLPELADRVVAHYDFDHPAEGADTFEADQGTSGTDIELVNGGTEMRVADAAYPGAGEALQTQQMSPDEPSNDDWKAGVHNPDGVESLSGLAGLDSTSVMGWFKPTGLHPALNSNTEDPDDRYNAIGLAGVLTGTSDGHAVRALLEVIQVDGELKIVALARRVDGEASWTYAADLPWDEILVRGEWAHLAASFDFAEGEMQLFLNGEELEGDYTRADNPWGEGSTSPSVPAGIKIGGSFPQNTREANPFTGRMDDLMFLDTALTPEQVAAQYDMFDVQPPAEPTIPGCSFDEELTDLMAGENWQPRTPELWEFPGDEIILAEPGSNPDDGIRRPFEYALLDHEPFGSVQMEADVRLDAPATVNNRDIILVFGHQSDTEYYYAHLSQDNTIYAHNGIFKVDGADRERIDDQYDGSVGAPPAVTDEEWHNVRLVHCAETGEIAVWVDGLDRPLLTATDTSFAEGRVGFGSFDNTGRMRDLTVSTPADEPDGPALALSDESVRAHSSVTVTGAGFEPGEHVFLRIDGQPGVAARVFADDDGGFEVEMRIRPNTSPGEHEVVATGRSSGAEARATLEVLPR